MELKKIKLAGFKSFVDPTVIHFQSKRTAVVGPNGCGKSNIIDAVRWVMGESSAKQLRGESMADVIFNGTNSRKPVGQAAIELVFDNTNTPLTGEYAAYSEIALRREVNREGYSNYYLNNARCRRKDIVDVFLGTGLGPHSYSVIEQGMISQLIEAKPEELRGYLEEAAGISKYKERRRETENRIRHTKDNLDRLNDIREELGRQIRHLKRQANAANRYKILKQEQRLLRAQLQALHWRTVNDQLVSQEGAINEKELELEAKATEQGQVNTAIEKLRTEQEDAAEVYNEVQGRYYRLGSEVGRIEQQIQHNKERCQQLEQDLAQLNQAWQQTEQHIKNDREAVTALETEQQELRPQEDELETVEQQTKQALLLAEENMNEWQHVWDSFNSSAAESDKQAEVGQTRIGHLEQLVTNENHLLEKLRAELAAIDFSKLAAEITDCEAECATIKQQSEKFKHDLGSQREKITAQRENNHQLLNELTASRHELQQLQGRAVSLETLQQVALGKTDQVVNDWLTANQLADKPRLAEQLAVESGWEKAVETVLSGHLEAVCIKDFARISQTLASLEKGNLNLFIADAESIAAKPKTLASKVTTKLPIINLLNNIYLAENISAGVQMRATLQPHESVITKDGIWLGCHWIKINAITDNKKGVLQREKELLRLKDRIKQKQAVTQEQEQKLEKNREKLTLLEQEIVQLQNQYNQSINEYSGKYGNLTAKQSELQHNQQRQQNIKTEIVEHEQRIAVSQQQRQTIEELWQQAETQKSTHAERRTILLAQREQYRSGLEMARQNTQVAQDNSAKNTMRLEFIGNKLQYLTQNLERATAQLTSFRERKEVMVSSLSDTKSPLVELDQELAAALQRRLAVENELTAAKTKVDELAHSLREQERKRTDIEQIILTMHSRLEQIRMEWKALQVRCSTYEEQIEEANFNLTELLKELSEEATSVEWEEKIAVISKKIERLGPINLAAITEYEQNLERKNYLDAQNDDLVEALSTLEDAMRKIDQETKAKFKHAYETVNSEFQRLFPIVFGGGKAELLLTADDLLQTGVFIKAQPPGKRNATIHLLSGGEKALTAIALVFAIFQLNPAPFCMLDEVDAPLDDNNVNRFCNLVREMSNTVQFIFISHNKITMEMAEQLMGITMQEPGVSRVVSVDINQALNMANKKG